MDLAGLSELLSERGWALLESLPPYDEASALGLGEQLRAQGYDPALVAAALTQSRLRAVARAKFGPFADGMLFTPEGLEQATRLTVAARHAQRFVSAGIERVADLGCGIGADAMALASFDREVLAVERDELTAAVATMNLRHWPHARVLHADATALDDAALAGVGGAFLDPARRTPARVGASGARAARRVLDPEAASPPLSFAVSLATRLAAVGVKTAPGISHHRIPEGVEAQWVSVGGEVVEAGLWFGLAARDEVRRAALVVPEGDGEAVELTGTGTESAPPPDGRLGALLYEPDGAVIRAGLIGVLAPRLGARLIDPTIAYLTGDTPTRSPLARAYAVQDAFPFQLKTLRGWLRDRGVGRLTVKKRGTAVTPEQLRRQLRISTAWGENEATIVLTRLAGRQSVVAVRPLA